MAEVGISVAAKLAEYFVDPALQGLQYLFFVGKITKNFGIRKEELILKKGKVQERIEEAINKTERIDDEVDKWNNEVESLIAEVEKMAQELKAKNGCFQRWCLWMRYYRCKELAKATHRMIELNTKSDHLVPFSHLVTVPDIEYHSSKDFMLFKSTKMASNQLLEALQNDDSTIIGLWGMGGSGKTTLVKQVGKKAKELKLFDRVVFTIVSQTIDIRKIQGEIADTLGLKLEEESETGRAKRIMLRLQSSKERILMIFDDVWAKFNLEDIGNPFGENHQRTCKVIMTTRRLDVCNLMDCEKTIPLQLLTEDEAWALFQTHANVDDGAKEVVAREVAMECEGLPIAIVAVGATLKGKGLDEMNVVLHKLRQSKPINVDESVRDAYACLELSYNYLRSLEAKLLLLMCAMFPEDHKIMIEDLFRYAIGLGLCKDADSFEIARSQVTMAINVLVDSSLLTYSSNFKHKKCVMMHDMVRDLALWIASKEHRTIKVINHAKELSKLLEDELAKDCYAVSSWYEGNKYSQFLSQLNAPKLEILLLNSRKPLDLLHASFEGVKGLKIVAIINDSYPKELQSQSIQWLSNLQTLRLQNWDLGDISFVIRLTRLEILDLKGSSFKKLPYGIEKLYKLKLLDLSGCRVNKCCWKVIGRCSRLEELYVHGNFRHQGMTNCYEYLLGIPTFPKLRRYILEMEQWDKPKIWNKDSRVLYLGQLSISISSEIIKDLAQRAIAIEFNELQGGCKSFFQDMVQVVGGMNELTKLCLRSCLGVECLIDKSTSHEDVIVPRLVELVLESMYNLKQLCHGPPLLRLFQNLESLKITHCLELHNIFPANCNLGNLKFFEIFHCPSLTSLFPISVACTLLSLEQLNIESCTGLKHVIEGEGDADAWEDLRFPKWEILSVSDCYHLEFVCPIFCIQGFVQLQHLSISDAPQLKFVFGGNAGEEQSMLDPNETQIVLPLLKDLKLQNLPKLRRICSASYHLRWPSITKIHWTNCPKLNISCDSLIIGSELRQPHPNMELHVLNGSEPRNEEPSGLNPILQIPIFQYLKVLDVHGCAKLKFVLSADICQSLTELTSVKISNCEELEEIFSGNEETHKSPSTAQACLPKLQRLEIEWCDKLRFIFSISASVAASLLPQLSTLSISDASQLYEIFSCSNIERHDIDSEKEIMFPNLKDIKLEKLPRLVNVCQGFKLRILESCRVLVRECPKILPTAGALTYWSQMKLVRNYVLKWSQLSNNETFTPALSVLNSEELDIEGSRVQDSFQVIGDYAFTPLFSVLNSEELDSESSGDQDSFQVIGDYAFTPPLAVLNSEELDIESSNVQDSFQIIGDYAFTPPLSVLNSEELDIESSSVQYLLQVIGDDDDDDDEQLMDTEMLSSEHQILKCLAPTQVLNFQYLHSLEVIQCEKLKYLFSVSTIVHNGLPKLTSLALSNCKELEEIITDNEEPLNISNAQVCFPKLRKLKIERCKKLKRLFSESLAINLPQLNSLLITDAGQLEVIFGHRSEDDANNGVKILLPRLREIKLRNLPNLINVCHGLQLQAVQLSQIVICNCPKFLNPIIFGSTKMVSLQQWETMSPQVSIEVSDCQHAANVGKKLAVNEEKGTIVISRVKLLALKDSAIKSIWKVPTLISFPYLRGLKVFGCRKLKCIYPGTVIRSLPRLKFLSIEECEDLEDIMSERDFPNPSSNCLCFPQLAKLVVRGCSKLKYLFPSLPSNEDLPQLKCLEIKRCSQLERLFSCKVEIHEEGLNQNVFPKLKEVILEGLPNLTDICGGLPFQPKFKPLRSLKVKNCPISKTTLAALECRDTDSEQESEDDNSVDSDDAYVKEFEHIDTFLQIRDASVSDYGSDSDDYLFG